MLCIQIFRDNGTKASKGIFCNYSGFWKNILSNVMYTNSRSILSYDVLAPLMYKKHRFIFLN